jgi:hypothetical protein
MKIAESNSLVKLNLSEREDRLVDDSVDICRLRSLSLRLASQGTLTIVSSPLADSYHYSFIQLIVYSVLSVRG